MCLVGINEFNRRSFLHNGAAVIAACLTPLVPVYGKAAFEPHQLDHQRLRFGELVAKWQERYDWHIREREAYLDRFPINAGFGPSSSAIARHFALTDYCNVFCREVIADTRYVTKDARRFRREVTRFYGKAAPDRLESLGIPIASNSELARMRDEAIEVRHSMHKVAGILKEAYE